MRLATTADKTSPTRDPSTPADAGELTGGIAAVGAPAALMGGSAARGAAPVATGGDGAAAAPGAPAWTLTASFMPLSQCPGTPQMKYRVTPPAGSGTTSSPVLKALRGLALEQASWSALLTSSCYERRIGI